MQCPCNHNKKYVECCKKAHDSIFSVSTAEQLMRSRYSAFVLADIEYLQRSHASKTRPSKKEKKETLAWTKSVEWLKLEIIDTTNGNPTDNTGTVSFKAFFIEDGKVNTINENSIFSKENKHWVYLNGVHY